MTIEDRVRELVAPVIGDRYDWHTGTEADLLSFLRNNRMAKDAVFFGPAGFTQSVESSDPFVDSYSLLVRRRAPTGGAVAVAPAASADMRALRDVLHHADWEEEDAGRRWEFIVTGGGPMAIAYGFDAYEITFNLI